MAFHEYQFPTGISAGSRGGPGFSTSIVEGDAGGSERVSQWANARRQHNVKWGIKSLDQLNQVIDFYVARMGPAIGFRYKNWLDFTTAPNHRDPHGPGDVLLGTAAGSSGQFQLRTKYVSGPTTVYRSIQKPVAGTVRVGRTPSGGGSLVEIFTFSVDTTTGLATISSGLTAGDTVTAGFEFDEASQFGKEIDGLLAASLTDFNQGDLPDIPIVEMIGNVASPERFYYGGGLGQTFPALFSIDFSQRVWVPFNSTAWTALLPDPTDLELGAPYFHVLAGGTGTGTLKTFDNVNTVATLATGKGAFLVVYLDTVAGINKWGAISN